MIYLVGREVGVLTESEAELVIRAGIGFPCLVCSTYVGSKVVHLSADVLPHAWEYALTECPVVLDAVDAWVEETFGPVGSGMLLTL